MSEDATYAGGTFVVFRLGSEEYGLTIDSVRSIIRWESATPVPRAPEAIQGVINLRGTVIPVVDLSRRLHQTVFEPGPTSRIVVAEGEAGLIGLAVDAASEVVEIAGDAIRPAPESVLTSETADVITAVAERESGLVILLDLERAVSRSEYSHLTDRPGPEGGANV